MDPRSSNGYGGKTAIGEGRRCRITPFNMSDLLYNAREEVLVLDDDQTFPFSQPQTSMTGGVGSALVPYVAGSSSVSIPYFPSGGGSASVPSFIPSGGVVPYLAGGDSVSVPYLPAGGDFQQNLPAPLSRPRSSSSSVLGSPKTELCRWFMRCMFGDDCRCGWHRFCPFGTHCRYAHGGRELRPKVCREFRSTGKCSRHGCNFLHE